MKPINELKLGFSDAENYQRRENKDLFNDIFVKNEFLDQLLENSTFFLIGEKGTGKTAYSVFLSNNNYKESVCQLKYLRETDYQKFVTLKKEKHLELSDYVSIWKVVLLLLLSKGIAKSELDHFPIRKTIKFNAIRNAIDEYYQAAFSPEIINVLTLVENSKLAAELISKHIKIASEEGTSTSFQESRFQLNLLYLENQFKDSFFELRLRQNHILFIDGIDIRPGSIRYEDYLECVKGLANAIWELDNDFFPTVRDSKGRMRIVLLLRPDIFVSLGLQNMTNKVRDNSVYLDWRTTYPAYRTSKVFELSDRLLSAQQDELIPFGACWDHYFPWKSKSSHPEREMDDSFIDFLRISYSRPRDLVTMVAFLQEEFKSKGRPANSSFFVEDFHSSDFQNKYSEYLMGGIRDQLSFYYDDADYQMFLRFFNFLENKAEFTFEEYVNAYRRFTEFILNNHKDIPEFVESDDKFLQFLYDSNIVSYIEQTELEPLFRWCYRERSPSNISPKVKLGLKYRIHYGLHKALNVGFRNRRP
jgi:hypothetical protein